MKRLIVPLATGFLILSSVAWGQDLRILDSKQNDSLSSQSSIRVRISAVSAGSFGPARDQFKVGESVVIVIFMTNGGNERTTVWISDPYYQNRPKLTRDGEEIEYRQHVNDVLKWKDNEGCGAGRSAPADLDPNIEKEVDSLRLTDSGITNNIVWYDSLEPGKYELTIRRRLGCAPTPQIESNKFNFEVVAK